MSFNANQVCVKFDFTPDLDLLGIFDPCISVNFGAENSSTKFYLSLACCPVLSLYLHLAECNRRRLAVHLKAKQVKISIGEEVSLYSNGVISFDEPLQIALKLISRREGMRFECEVYYEMDSIQLKTQTLSQQLSALRLDPILSDITLVTKLDGKEFPAHKVILASASPVFAAMFKHSEFVENQKKRVEIEDVTGEIMKMVLDFIYSREESNVKDYACELFDVSDKYDIQPLVLACIDAMKTGLSEYNAAKYLSFADLRQLDDLKEEVINFILNNRQLVKHSDGWKQFVEPNDKLFKELFDLVW